MVLVVHLDARPLPFGRKESKILQSKKKVAKYTEEIYLESVQHGKKLLSDIPHVDVTVSVIHGGKFKLVSIACC